MRPRGWRNESHNHSLAAQGVSTRKYLRSKWKSVVPIVRVNVYKMGDDLVDRKRAMIEYGLNSEQADRKLDEDARRRTLTKLKFPEGEDSDKYAAYERDLSSNKLKSEVGRYYNPISWDEFNNVFSDELETIRRRNGEDED